jgi:hypothetical protein
MTVPNNIENKVDWELLITPTILKIRSIKNLKNLKYRGFFLMEGWFIHWYYITCVG